MSDTSNFSEPLHCRKNQHNRGDKKEVEVCKKKFSNMCYDEKVHSASYN